MSKIKVLEKHVSQLIAAGEVVERPASVVKELLENSIDSKATRIQIEIKNGGIKFLKISDNGCGIERSDVKTAFLRHATSKISKTQDLCEIGTLGFRGEALASICAVSKTEMITRTKNEENGTRIVIHGENQKILEDVGCFIGTIIVVKDLFYNIPARMKFLKKDVIEANAVAEIIDKLALSHPQISFTFIREGKKVLVTPGDKKISSAVYSVYGKEFFDTMIPLDYTYQNINIQGFVSIPEKSKPTKISQNFFLNGRYVRIKTASSALLEAFKGRIMVNRYPYCVIYLKAPFSDVDVNVHPTKMEVKFTNEKPIFEAIYYSVKTALSNHITTPLLDMNNKNLTVSDSKPIFTKNSVVNEIKQNKKNVLPESNETHNTLLEKTLPQQSGPTFTKISKDHFLNLNIEEKKLNSDLKIIGEIFKCYVIVQKGDYEIILIDKHAAHERLIYEKLKKNENQNQSQILLEPIVVNLEKSEHLAILQNLDVLEKAGYSVEDFGLKEVIVRGIPQYLPQSETFNSIIEIADNLLAYKNANTSFLDWVYHNIACRAAIKSGMTNDYTEILNLIKNLQDNSELVNCPHGRPIYLNLQKNFFEKKFKRI